MRQLSLVSVVVVLAMGCAEQKDMEMDSPKSETTVGGSVQASSASLTGTHWTLVELNGRPAVPSDMGRDAHLVLNKEDGKIAGSGGVNRFFGAYTLEGGKLTLKPGGSTMMAGPEELMQQEQAFTQMLMAVKSYHIAGDRLELLDGQTVVAKFKVGQPKS
jgi:heat shock protein HslJ